MANKRNNANYDKTDEFLKDAISDLSGNLTLIDTKISIILATVGVILGLVVACKSNILKAYYFYSDNNISNVVFLLLSLIYVISIIITFIYGIKCIMIRFGKSDSKSLWFFKTKDYGGISEENYIQKVKCMSEETMMKNYAAEVYKLNQINNKKMYAGKVTIILFAVSCATIATLMVMVGISYLVV